MLQGFLWLTAGVFAVAAIYKTVAPRLGRIIDALHGRPQPLTDEQRGEHWRRVHLEADRRVSFPMRRARGPVRIERGRF